MGIIIEDIRYLDKFRPSETDVDWALYNIAELAEIEIDFRVEEVAIATSKSFDDVGWIQASGQPRETGLPLTSGVIWTDISGAFQNFYVGDEVTITGTGSNDGTYTIIYKENDEVIQVSSSLQFKFFPLGAAIYVSTPFRGLRYYYNFLANDGATNFNSLTTGEAQLLDYDNIDNTDFNAYSMVFKGLKDYQVGGATIKGNGSSAYGQRFILKHTTILNPLYLEAQYDDLIAGVKPTYFESDNCLKHIFRLEVNRDLSNPNDTISVDYDERLGNTGWFNENYNGGGTNYVVNNVVINRVSDAEVVSKIELLNSCDVNFRVTNIIDSPFSAGNTKGMAIFYQLPEEENYINNGRTYSDNFVYDRIIQTEGAPPVSGSTGYAIDEFEITYIDNDNIDVRIRISISNNGKNYINENDFKRYLLSFIIENHALTRETSDKVNLLVNVNDFGISLFDSNLIDNETKFLFHRYSEFSDGVDNPDVFPVDDMVAYSQFNIDFNGLESDNIDIISVSNELVLKHATNADITLESNTYNTGGSTLLNGYVPLIDLEQNRAYTIPDNDFRRLVQIKRDESNDSGTIYSYKSIYPFFVRWEWWEALNISNPPSGVYDSNEPNNGLNNFWFRFSTLGYTLNYRLRFTITQNGELFTQEFDNPLTMYDFNSNPEWSNEYIKSYDVATSTELISGSDKFLQGYTDSRVEIGFTKTIGSLPNIDDIDIVAWIIGKENGTFKSVRRASSFYSNSGDTWFKGITVDELINKSNVVSLYKGEVLTDFTKLSGDEFTIYARLHDNEASIPVDAKLMEDGTVKLMEDGTIKILD